MKSLSRTALGIFLAFNGSAWGGEPVAVQEKNDIECVAERELNVAADVEKRLIRAEEDVDNLNAKATSLQKTAATHDCELKASKCRFDKLSNAHAAFKRRVALSRVHCRIFDGPSFTGDSSGVSSGGSVINLQGKDDVGELSYVGSAKIPRGLFLVVYRGNNFEPPDQNLYSGEHPRIPVISWGRSAKCEYCDPEGNGSSICPDVPSMPTALDSCEEELKKCMSDQT